MTDEDQQYGPGSFGCHEALHMSHVLCDSVGTQLMEHKAIERNPEWLALATEAHETLFKLYQLIGSAHL